MFCPFEPPYVCDWLKKTFFAAMIFQKYYLDLGSDKTLVSNFFARSSEVSGAVAECRLHSQSRSSHGFKLMVSIFFLEYS